MSSPGELLADRLTAQFLENGNFMSAPGMKALPSMGLEPALVGRQADEFEAAFDDAGFAGLAVQAVGFEQGGKDEKVHIYVARGSRKAVAIAVGNQQVEVEVNRIGKLLIRPEQAITTTHRGNLYLRGERVACGSSCAPGGENYSGTFGALLRKTGGRTLYALSNNHVFGACNHTPVGMPILAPSNADGRANGRAPGEIARMAEICELRSGVPDLVTPGEEDIAIANVINPDGVSSWQGDDSTGYDTPTGVARLASNLRVKKFGRTTGLTTGAVESRIKGLIFIHYKARSFSAVVWFRNVWTVKGDKGRPFALPGDSGSLIVTEDEKHAVGLLFATQNDYGVIIPMDRVTASFGGCKLVGGHGI